VPNVLSGTIDLVFNDANSWRLVDYRTDADVDSETLQARSPSEYSPTGS
jgi:ATP-dependent exoDNAse (exonuclease V) beta subunit